MANQNNRNLEKEYILGKIQIIQELLDHGISDSSQKANLEGRLGVLLNQLDYYNNENQHQHNLNIIPYRNNTNPYRNNTNPSNIIIPYSNRIILPNGNNIIPFINYDRIQINSNNRIFNELFHELHLHNIGTHHVGRGPHNHPLW